MILTRELLHQACTKKDGFTRAQVESLGITWPPKKGWLSGMIGKEVTEEQYAEFVRLNGVFVRGKRRDEPHHDPFTFIG